MYPSINPKCFRIQILPHCALMLLQSTTPTDIFTALVLNAISEILHARICSFLTVTIKPTAFPSLESSHIFYARSSNSVTQTFHIFIILTLQRLARYLWERCEHCNKEKEVNVMQKLITLNKSLEVNRTQLRKCLKTACNAANKINT